VASTPDGRADSIVSPSRGELFFALPQEDKMSIHQFFGALQGNKSELVVYAQAQNNRHSLSTRLYR
jgi:ATP-dependent protease ClpP protease subunit